MTYPPRQDQWGPPPPPYGPPPRQHEFATLPPKNNHTLLIGLSAALGVMLLLGGTAGTVIFYNASRAEPAPAPVTAAPEPSSQEPTEQADEPAEEPADEPADETGDATKAAPGSPITHREFGDWDFRFEKVRFNANKAGGWSYDTCDPVDGQGVLADTKCERAIQVAYSAYRGHLKAVQVTMAFPNVKAAKTAATRLAKLDARALNIRSDMTLARFEYGQIRANVAKQYVIATIVTADRTAQPKAAKFHLYLQADAMSYFLLRDVTVTS
ncbi:hypothetical protein GCM10009850_095120 [Nonomuraea monospora]|uniref:Uncharacterized protein n=1 Tax=Nonomuraea monospora TaxID=568818 RepID=A0ABP5PQX2_9ACTN